MKFQDSKGVLRVVRGKHTYPNQVVTCNSMISILRHGDIEWDYECHITSPKTSHDENFSLYNHLGEFVISPTSYTSKFCSIHPNEVWVKGFFFMMPHEEYGTPRSTFYDDMELLVHFYYVHFHYVVMYFDDIYYVLMMFGRMNTRKLDPIILFPNGMGWGALSTIGVQYKQWDPRIV